MGLRCFVCMPFDSTFDDVYELGIKAAVEGLGDECRRVDRVHFAGSIPERIRGEIARADYLVVDITGTHHRIAMREGAPMALETNPNVAYELGCALALGKVAVLILDGNHAPFDIAHQAQIRYERAHLATLKGSLTERVRELTRDVRGAIPGYAEADIDNVRDGELVVFLGVARPVNRENVGPYLEHEGLDKLPTLTLSSSESKHLSNEELRATTEHYAALLKRFATKHQRARKIHVFYGGPVAAAMRLGQELRPMYFRGFIYHPDSKQPHGWVRMFEMKDE